MAEEDFTDAVDNLLKCLREWNERDPRARQNPSSARNSVERLEAYRNAGVVSAAQLEAVETQLRTYHGETP